MTNEKPVCAHTKYVGVEPCICSQFESYWRSRLLPEFQAKAVEAVENHQGFRVKQGYSMDEDDVIIYPVLHGELVIRHELIEAIKGVEL